MTIQDRTRLIDLLIYQGRQENLSSLYNYVEKNRKIFLDILYDKTYNISILIKGGNKSELQRRFRISKKS